MASVKRIACGGMLLPNGEACGILGDGDSPDSRQQVTEAQWRHSMEKQ